MVYWFFGLASNSCYNFLTQPSKQLVPLPNTLNQLGLVLRVLFLKRCNSFLYTKINFFIIWLFTLAYSCGIPGRFIVWRCYRFCHFIYLNRRYYDFSIFILIRCRRSWFSFGSFFGRGLLLGKLLQCNTCAFSRMVVFRFIIANQYIDPIKFLYLLFNISSTIFLLTLPVSLEVFSFSTPSRCFELVVMQAVKFLHSGPHLIYLVSSGKLKLSRLLYLSLYIGEQAMGFYVFAESVLWLYLF